MSAFNRIEERARTAHAFAALASWEPTEIDQKLADPVGAAFTVTALDDYFRWAPDSFNDDELASLSYGSLTLWEMIRDAAERAGFAGGEAYARGSWYRVVKVKGTGLHEYPVIFNPGARRTFRYSGGCYVTGAHKNDRTYVADNELGTHWLEEQIFGGGA